MILSPQCGVYTEYTHEISFNLWANWEININSFSQYKPSLLQMCLFYEYSVNIQLTAKNDNKVYQYLYTVTCWFMQ